MYYLSEQQEIHVEIVLNLHSFATITQPVKVDIRVK